MQPVICWLFLLLFIFMRVIWTLLLIKIRVLFNNPQFFLLINIRQELLWRCKFVIKFLLNIILRLAFFWIERLFLIRQKLTVWWFLIFLLKCEIYTFIICYYRLHQTLSWIIMLLIRLFVLLLRLSRREN